MKNNPLVSIVIPTKNSAEFLEATLRSIQKQRYKPIEILIIDGNSTDNTFPLAKKYHSKVFAYAPTMRAGTFDAPFKRNYGVRKAKGTYVYCVDADMELQPDVVGQAVRLCEGGNAAVIVPEDSIGVGLWARAKKLERRCYWGDDLIESPRFFRKQAWEEVGGVDESLVSGRDDGDLHQKILEHGYTVGRTKDMVLHNEGKLTVKRLFFKKVMYGKDVLSYIKKRPRIGILSYSPIRSGFINNWRLFVQRPLDALVFIVMKTIENTGGIVGILLSLKDRVFY